MSSYSRCKSESLEAAKIASEVGPKLFSRDNLEAFTIPAYFEELCQQQPILMHALSGVVMLNQKVDNIQVTCGQFKQLYICLSRTLSGLA